MPVAGSLQNYCINKYLSLINKSFTVNMQRYQLTVFGFILQWGITCFFLKMPVKVGKIIKSAFITYFTDG